MPIAVTSASSPSRMNEISARVKPSTRRLASSRLRSENEIRAALYTTPNAIVLANSTLKKIMTPIVSSIVLRKLSSAARLSATPATAGVSFSCRYNRSSSAASTFR